jgi:hypothetical protein
MMGRPHAIFFSEVVPKIKKENSVDFASQLYLMGLLCLFQK